MSSRFQAVGQLEKTRAFVAAFAATSVASSVFETVRHGRSTPDHGGLLFLPSDRFNDLVNTLQGISQGNAYVAFSTSSGAVFPFGNVYPPAHVAVLTPLARFAPDFAVSVMTFLLAVAVFILVRISARGPWRLPLTLTMAPNPALTYSLIAFLSVFALTVVARESLSTYVLVLPASALVACALTMTPAAPLWLRTQTPTAIVFVFCYPTIFALDRMNVDILVLLGLAASLALIQGGRIASAGLMFGAVTAFKLYPVILLFAFIDGYRRTIRFAIVACVGAVALTAIGLALTPLAVEDTVMAYRLGLAWFEQEYAIHPRGLSYSTSIFNGLVAAKHLAEGTFPAAFASALYPVWVPIQALALLAAMLIPSALGFPSWSRWMIATTSVAAFMPATSEYRMILLLPAVALWLGDPRSPAGLRAVHLALGVAIGLALAPKAFLAPIQTGGDPFTMMTADSLLNPVVLATVLVLSYLLGWRERSVESVLSHWLRRARTGPRPN